MVAMLAPLAVQLVGIELEGQVVGIELKVQVVGIELEVGHVAVLERALLVLGTPMEHLNRKKNSLSW